MDIFESDRLAMVLFYFYDISVIPIISARCLLTLRSTVNIKMGCLHPALFACSFLCGLFKLLFPVCSVALIVYPISFLGFLIICRLTISVACPLLLSVISRVFVFHCSFTFHTMFLYVPGLPRRISFESSLRFPTCLKISGQIVRQWVPSVTPLGRTGGELRNTPLYGVEKYIHFHVPNIGPLQCAHYA